MSKTGFNPVMGDARNFTARDIEVVESGRVTIPAKKREMYDIKEGDWVHIAVHTEKSTFRSNDIEVQRKGQITIPHRQRERYNIEKGDSVHLEVKKATS